MANSRRKPEASSSKQRISASPGALVDVEFAENGVRAPFGYRYLRKTDHAGACYKIIEHEATLVAELFRRYADRGASIADLARWLTVQGVLTRTCKHRWDRSVVWGMLRNPACAGTAVFGKTT